MDLSNALHPANVDDGDHFLPGANTSRREIPKPPSMCLLYGYILAENQPSDHAAFEIQHLSCSFEDNGEIFGGQENEHGEYVFDIHFSQDDNDYLVKLVFGPVIGLSDQDSQQEDRTDDGEETYEDHENDYHVCNLYFPGYRYYVVRLVFENEEEEDRFLEKEDEFLFKKLQRAAGISSDGEEEEEEEEEEEVPVIDDKSSGDLGEIVSENSSKLMELKIEEHDDDVRVELPERGKGTENGINEDQSSGNFVDDPQIMLEQQKHLIAQIVSLQFSSSA